MRVYDPDTAQGRMNLVSMLIVILTDLSDNYTVTRSMNREITVTDNLTNLSATYNLSDGWDLSMNIIVPLDIDKNIVIDKKFVDKMKDFVGRIDECVEILTGGKDEG